MKKRGDPYKTAVVERDVAVMERRIKELDKELEELKKKYPDPDDKQVFSDAPEEIRRPYRDRAALSSEKERKERLLDALNFKAPSEYRTFEVPKIDEFLRAIEMLPRPDVDFSAFPIREYADVLVKFRRELTDAQIKSETEGVPIALDLSENASFKKMLEYDDKLNGMLQSEDPAVRDAARSARDEAWRLSVEESSKERIEKLKTLDPAVAERLAAGRSKAGEEWLATSRKEFQNLFGRPDNMLGLYVVGSLVPIPGLMFLLPVVLPVLKTLFDALLMRVFVERSRNVSLLKMSIEERVLRDAAQANVLRLLGSASEKHGMSPTETYGLYVDQLQNPESVLRRVDETIARGPEAKDLTKKIKELVSPIAEANAVKKDAVGAFLGCELEWKGDKFVYKKPPNVDAARAEAELRRINRSIREVDPVDYLANERYVGKSASARPAEIVLLAKAIAASPKNIDYEELLMRTLPSNTAEKNARNVDALKETLLRQYGDCVRVRADELDKSLFRNITAEELRKIKDPDELRYVSCEGRKYIQMSPIMEVKELTLEHLVIAAACGREEAKREIAERARGDADLFRAALASLCNRMVHDKIRTMEEAVVVGFEARPYEKQPETPIRDEPAPTDKNKESFDPVTPFSQSDEFSAFRDEKDSASRAAEPARSYDRER